MPIQPSYGTSTSITCTIASLANNGMRQSTAVSNSAGYFGVRIGGTITSASASTSSTGYVNVYAAGSADNGTTYNGDASGSDASYTGKTTNLILLTRVDVTTNSTAYEWGAELESIFTNIPNSWVLVFENKTGATLSASGQAVHYQGMTVENT